MSFLLWSFTFSEGKIEINTIIWYQSNDDDYNEENETGLERALLGGEGVGANSDLLIRQKEFPGSSMQAET